MGYQNLTLAVNNSTEDGGFEALGYAKKHNGAKHRGHDYKCNHTFDVVGSGDGKVVFCGKDRKELMNVIGIYYAKAFLPGYGFVDDVVFRYIHLLNLNVQVGQLIERGQKLGQCIGIYDDPQKLYPAHHLHLEIDYDTKFPRNSPTIRKLPPWKILLPGTASVYNPAKCLYIGPGQSIVGNPDNSQYSPSDLAFARL
jgi:murein DD-endopeptidase MepM/ murein hydrolase activator NlpD